MKQIILFSFLACWPLSAFSQSFVNPDTTQQPGDIYIQNTDVNYYPMAPDTSDSRESLCSDAEKLLNPNGVPTTGFYHPVTHDTVLQNWRPCGVPLGNDAIWQRFFTAKRHGGIPSDLIAGSNVTNDTAHTNGHHGPVIISKNEDVDFRASGTVKLENGFHAMPGCFFHAYQEPRWGSTVLSDDFDSSTLDKANWRVTNAHNDDYEFFGECSSDSGVQIVSDTGVNGALDGHALDIILREVPDTCSCFEQDWRVNDTCNDDINPRKPINKFAFSGAMLHSCPFPWVSRDSLPLVPAYQHAPYGKYEVREKIPHVMHHVNNWEYDQFEYDMNECWNGNMNDLHPGAGTGTWHGPYKGNFGLKSGTRVFRCSQANWCLSNNPTAILVGANFDFDVQLNLTPTDTFLTVSGTTYNMGGFPSSFADSTGSITFYYRRLTSNVADAEAWSISPDGRIFSAPYRTIHGVPLIFSKSYQPTSITLLDSLNSITGNKTSHTWTCHWIDSLNDPINYGKLYLDKAMGSAYLHSDTEAYSYSVTEGYGPVPPYGFNGMDTTGYAYHTFTMELLPNETRILMDSNVVWRGPDRLDPPGDSDSRGGWIPRSPVGIRPSEIDIDENAKNPDGTLKDPLGMDTTTFVYDSVKYWNSITGEERQWFDAHDTNRAMGCWDVTIGGKTYHAAHHLVDYVKIWDIPSDVIVPKFPQ